MEGISEWKEKLERERKEKDEFFAVHWQSPIPPEERAKFRGLVYYPPTRITASNLNFMSTAIRRC